MVQQIVFKPDFGKTNPYENAPLDYLKRIKGTSAYKVALERGWITDVPEEIPPTVQEEIKPPEPIVTQFERIDTLSQEYNIPSAKFVTAEQLNDLKLPVGQRKYKIKYDQYLTPEQMRFLGYDVPEGVAVRMTPTIDGDVEFFAVNKYKEEPEIITENTLVPEIADFVMTVPQLRYRMEEGFPVELTDEQVAQYITDRINNDFYGFVNELFDTVGEDETAQFLENIGVSEEYILGSLSEIKQNERIETSIQTVFPGYDLNSFMDLVQYDYNGFINEIQTYNPDVTWIQKRRMMEDIGFSPQEINNIMRYRKFEVVPDSINASNFGGEQAPILPDEFLSGMTTSRMQITVDNNTGNAYDEYGDYIGKYDIPTREFTPREEKAAIDQLDTLLYASKGYYENFEDFVLGVAIPAVYPELDFMPDWFNNYTRGVKVQMEKLYQQNRNNYNTWLENNADKAPPREYQEGALKNPDLLTDGGYWAYEITNILPFVISSLGITALTGGAGAGYVVLSTLSMGGVEGGALYNEIRDLGIDDDKARYVSVIAGTLIGSLESAGRIPMLKQLNGALFGRFSKEAAKELAIKSAREAVKRFGIGVTKDVLAEVVTEMAQEVVGNFAYSFFGDKSLFENVPDIAVKTLIATLPLAGLSTGGETIRMIPPSQLNISEAEKIVKGWVKDAKGHWYEVVREARENPERGSFQFGKEENIEPIQETPELTPEVVGQLKELGWEDDMIQSFDQAEVDSIIRNQQKPTLFQSTENVVIETPEEFAGNIRLEKYDEEVRPLISEWVEQNKETAVRARRGIVSDSQVRQEAEKLVNDTGGDIDKLRRRWKPGTAWNAEEILALRGLLQEKTKEVISAQKTAREVDSSQNQLKLLVALKEQAAVQEIIHGITAEAGRALRQFRQDAFDAIQNNDTKRIAQLLKSLGGKVDVDEIAAKIAQIDIDDPVALNKFVQSLYKPKLMDYLTEIFYNSILSGPKTHIVNSMSNTMNLFLSPVERAVSAGVDLPLSWAQGRERQRFFNEVPADIFGAVRGIPEGFRQFAYVIKNGISLEETTKWEFRQKAFKGKTGAVINLPSRLLEGADQLMKAINQRAAINAEAHRIASMEKLKGQQFDERVAELLSEPTADMLEEANRVAEYRLFRQKPGKLGQTLMNARDSVSFLGIKPLRFVFPFVRTPMNLVKFGLERSPLGWLNPGMWENIKRGDPEAADQIARAFIGTMGFAALTMYAAQGLITGAPPRDRAERDRFYREGKQPYAIRVGDFWVSYQRLEPFNQLLSQVSIVVEAINSGDDKDLDDKIWDSINTFGQNFISQTYMSSISDLLNMFAEPERYGGKWFNRFAASLLVPASAATRTAAQMFDDVVRDPENAWETIESFMPGLSNNVKAKLSVFGEDIQRKSPAWFPVSVTPVEETILSQELERLEYDIGFAGTSIQGYDLTEEQQYEYQKLSGNYVKSDLERLMLAPDYWQSTDEEKLDMMQSVVATARNRARSEMKSRMFGENVENIVEDLVLSVKSSDARLGEVISDVPNYSHEDPEIYDMDSLDTTFNKILKDVQQDYLTEDIPETAKSWYEKHKILEDTGSYPDTAFYQINSETDKDTYEDYYNQWQERLEITDPVLLAEFDKEYPDAHKGNFSRRTFEMLQEYHSLTGKEKDDYLYEHYEELTSNPYREWLISNPRENAVLALWGEAKLLTAESYDEFNKLVKSLDVPDSAIPKDRLPKNVETFLIQKNSKYMEVEDQLEIAKALDDEIKDEDGLTERDRRVMQLKQTVIEEGMTYSDISHKVDAMNAGTDDSPTPEETVNAWVDRGRVVDEFGAGSSEAKVWLVDNQEVWDWALKHDLLEDDGTGWNVEVLRINTEFREQDNEYNALPTTGTARKDYLNENMDYRVARRRRDALQLKNKLTGESFPANQIDNYITYYELPEKGYRRDRFLLNNKDFADAMHDIAGIDLPENVPNEEWDNITERYMEEFDKWNGLADNESEFYIENPQRRQDERDKLLYDNRSVTMFGYTFYNEPVLSVFGVAYYTRQAHYELREIQDNPNYQFYVNEYVAYKAINKPENWNKRTDTNLWFEDDWFLQEHADYYRDVYLGVMGNQRKDFSVLPTREVFAQYLHYVKLPTTGRLRDNYLSWHPELDEWMVNRMNKKPYEPPKTKPTPKSEKVAKQQEQWEKELDLIEEILEGLR